MTYEQKSAIVISQLRADRDRILDAFDKIKAEIYLKRHDYMLTGNYYDGVRFGLMLAYQIIDKYKAESEESDDKWDYCPNCDCRMIEPKWCDRNICIQNEYNGVGCNECNVTKD